MVLEKCIGVSSCIPKVDYVLPSNRRVVLACPQFGLSDVHCKAT